MILMLPPIRESLEVSPQQKQMRVEMFGPLSPYLVDLDQRLLDKESPRTLGQKVTLSTT